MSDKAFPLVLKDLKIMAIILNEDGTEVPLQVEVPRVVAASFSTNRQVTRVWGEDGRVCGATLPSWRHGHE